MNKTVTVSLAPGHTYQQTIAAGHHNVISDVATTAGGADGGPDPKDLALGALGACTAMTIIMVAAKRKWDLKSVSVTVTLTEETDPNDKKLRIAVITEDISVTGNLSDAELADIKAAAAKCPVYKLFEGAKRLVTNVIPPPAAVVVSSTPTDTTAPDAPDTPVNKADVARQFGRTAEAYARSPGHAHGADLQILLQLLSPQPTMTVLDVATGAGHTAAAVAPFVKKVTASDLAPEMIEQTLKLFGERGLINVEAVVRDVEALEFDDASFDAVTCRIAPHHFLDIEKALGEIARVLKPGGVFVLEDSCVPEARRQDQFINHLEKLRDPTHIRSYTKKEWKAILQRAGLNVVRVRNYRKTHDVADWIQRSDLSAGDQQRVRDAFNNAPAWARKQFAITYDGTLAVSYSDDKVILRAVKIA
jgi:ubiquinone/menaquinone biosynthesis C-methylase UbiE/uncharacterized OsmC-like protein